MPLHGPLLRCVRVVDARVFALLAILAVAALGGAPSASAAGTSVISGTLFKDMNRDAVQEPGESPLPLQGVYLLDANGQQQLAYTSSDASGAYTFRGLADGDYRVELGPSEWWQLRQDWTPTTTGSLLPRVAVRLSGSAVADFGWRPIVRSTDLAAPISSYAGPTGLRVFSYNDVVTAKELYDDVMAGSLTGAEASTVTVRFDYGTNADFCATSVSGSPGGFSNYSAEIDIAWLAWLDQGDQVLFHEYGHAWSLYYAYLAQQSTILESYLQARGIVGDPRLDTTHAWSRRELIAEDYRQLFGTPNARAREQENRDLPAAADVPGLRDFMAGAFMQPVAPAPAPAPSPAPEPAPAPVPPLAVSSVAMSPNPVKSSGTASLSLSSSAAVTVSIRDGAGKLVRTLLQSAVKPAGAVKVAWDRKNSNGQRVKSGKYTLSVDAVDTAGTHAAANTPFSVS